MAGDQSLLKRINRMALVRLVKAEPGLSRADLAGRSGLTKATVGALVQELIDEGWLAQRDPSPSQGVGRRPMPLTLDPSHLAVLGAEVGVDYLNVVACDLLGNVLSAHRVSYRHGQAARSARDLAGLLERAHAELSAGGRRALGVGVGVPGVVDLRSGMLRVAPNLGWRGVRVDGLLRGALRDTGAGALHLSVMNEADAAALSEYVFGADRHAGPLVYLSMGIGLGGGIVLFDRLYQGHDGLAGELGHTILDRKGPRCACGRRGCAETFISQRAVSRQVTGEEAPILSIDELEARVRRRDPATVRAARRAGEHLGLLLVNVFNTVDPEVVVLGGPLCQLGDDLVTTALATLTELSGDEALARRVRRCKLGLDACATGAAGSVFQAALNLSLPEDPGPPRRRAIVSRARRGARPA